MIVYECIHIIDATTKIRKDRHVIRPFVYQSIKFYDVIISIHNGIVN